MHEIKRFDILFAFVACAVLESNLVGIANIAQVKVAAVCRVIVAEVKYCLRTCACAWLEVKR